MQLRHEFGAELAPVVGRAVGALDEHSAHVGGVRLSDDRGDVAAVRLADIPDPHALTFECAGAGRSGDGRDGHARRGRVQGVAHDIDRSVGTRVATVAEQHHDVARVGVLGDRHLQPARGLTQMRGRGEARDARSRLAGKRDGQSRGDASAADQQASVKRDLVRVGAAAIHRDAPHTRDPHGADVRAGGRSAPAGRVRVGGPSAGRRGSARVRRGGKRRGAVERERREAPDRKRPAQGHTAR